MLRRTAHNRIGALLVGVLLTTIGLLPAATFGAPYQPESPTQPRVEIPDKNLYAFAKAYLKASRIYTVYEEKIRSTQDTGQVVALQKEANTRMNQAVAEEGLSVQEYNKIYLAAQRDEALRNKVNQLIRENDNQ